MITDEEIGAAEEDEPLEEYPEWQRKLIEPAKKVLETEDYISLPDKFDVHEYYIMERFYLSIDDERYEYKSEALKQIAIDWCKENSVEYIQQDMTVYQANHKTID